MLEATASLVARQHAVNTMRTPEPTGKAPGGQNLAANAETYVPTLTHPEWQNDIRMIASAGEDNPLLIRDFLTFLIRIENDMAPGLALKMITSNTAIHKMRVAMNQYGFSDAALYPVIYAADPTYVQAQILTPENFRLIGTVQEMLQKQPSGQLPTKVMTSNGHKINFTVEHNHDAIAKLPEMVLSLRETVLAQNEKIIGLHKEITIMKPLIAGAKQEGLWMKNIKWWENNEPIHT